jgi:hypothetical protein
MTLGEELFAFRRALFEPGDRAERLTRTIAGGKAAFAARPLPSLLDQLLSGRPRARAALREALRLDHFGMLLSPADRPLLSTAAAAAGFPMAHAAFPSALFTRELGRLLEQRRVPTTIFKAHGRTASGNALAIEVFLPQIDDAQAEAWMARGVGNHVALVLPDAAAFTAATQALRDDGLRISWFMFDQPLYISTEEVTLVYFDLEESDAPLRLELRVAGDVTAGA